LLDTNEKTFSGKHHFIYWFIAVLIIATGVYLSIIEYMQNEWLSRAGCLIVMLGIWLGIGSILQERIIFTRIKWHRRKALAAAKKQSKENKTEDSELEKQLAVINQGYDNQIIETTQKLRISIGMLEVSLLLTGTFLWGFGDLLIG
jgi:uncharacterized membrane protein YcjF (UPF0283 family)